MKATYLAALCLGIALGTSTQSFAGALASVAGSLTGESEDLSDHKSGTIAVNISVDNADAFDGYIATAEVFATTLRASAEAHTIASLGSAPNANAMASWSDHLTLENPDVYVNYLPAAYAYFSPTADGNGKNGSITFSASLNDGVNPEISRTEFFEFLPTKTTGTIPFSFKIPLSVFVDGVNFNMSLEARAEASAFDSTLLDSVVDYSHTAILPPIFLGDVDGNPIPELAGAQIVGSSGFSYAVTTTLAVPEPGSGVMVLLGGVLLLTGGRGGVRRG